MFIDVVSDLELWDAFIALEGRKASFYYYSIMAMFAGCARSDSFLPEIFAKITDKGEPMR
jgi:hypothetical protein